MRKKLSESYSNERHNHLFSLCASQVVSVDPTTGTASNTPLTTKPTYQKEKGDSGKTQRGRSTFPVPRRPRIPARALRTVFVQRSQVAGAGAKEATAEGTRLVLGTHRPGGTRRHGPHPAPPSDRGRPHRPRGLPPRRDRGRPPRPPGAAHLNPLISRSL